MSDRGQTPEEGFSRILENPSLEKEEVAFLKQMSITLKEVRKENDLYRQDFKRKEILLGIAQQERDDTLAAKEAALQEKARVLEGTGSMNRQAIDEIHALHEAQKSDKELITLQTNYRRTLTEEVTHLRSSFLGSQAGMKELVDALSEANSKNKNLAEKFSSLVTLVAPGIEPDPFSVNEKVLQRTTPPILGITPGDAPSAASIVSLHKETGSNQM